MQIIIFEGIPTSGKTSTIEKLIFELGQYKTEVIHEDLTLMKILENKDEEVALKHLNSIKRVIQKKNTDFLIIDRFHYTHIFRSNSNFDYFKEIENWLSSKDAKVIIMKMSFHEIMNRINLSLTHRGDTWREYVGKKGDTDAIKQYYFNQQIKLLEIASGSVLDNIVINTDKRNWGDIALKIKNYVQ